MLGGFTSPRWQDCTPAFAVLNSPFPAWQLSLKRRLAVNTQSSWYETGLTKTPTPCNQKLALQKSQRSIPQRGAQGGCSGGREAMAVCVVHALMPCMGCVVHALHADTRCPCPGRGKAGRTLTTVQLQNYVCLFSFFFIFFCDSEDKNSWRSIRCGASAN